MMELEAGDVYEHRVHGEVKIGSIVDLYSRYEVDEQVGYEPTTVVEFGTGWDEYGIFEPTQREKIHKFTDRISIQSEIE